MFSQIEEKRYGQKSKKKNSKLLCKDKASVTVTRQLMKKRISVEIYVIKRVNIIGDWSLS